MNENGKRSYWVSLVVISVAIGTFGGIAFSVAENAAGISISPVVMGPVIGAVCGVDVGIRHGKSSAK